MANNTDPVRALIAELRDGCVYHRKRCSGDTHADLGTYIDEGATDALMAKAADRLESAFAQQPAVVDEFAHDRERLLRAFMMECGIIGAKEAGVNLARGIKDTLAAYQQGGAE